MSDNKHTPGPWVWDYKWRLNGSNKECVTFARGGWEPFLADAALIAAAPDLLAACEMAVLTIINDTNEQETMDALRTAIKKAKGE